MSQIFSFFQENTASLRIFSFALVLLGVLIIAHQLLYQLVYAFAPESKSGPFVMKPRPVRVAIALADIAAWGLAVMISCKGAQIACRHATIAVIVRYSLQFVAPDDHCTVGDLLF